MPGGAAAGGQKQQTKRAHVASYANRTKVTIQISRRPAKRAIGEGKHRGLRSGAMLELLAAGAALAGRALLQAADTGLLAVGEDDLRAEEHHYPLRARWLLELKREPESTAAALRGASSALLAFAAVACAIVVGDILFRAGVHSNSRSTLQLLAGLLAGAIALMIDLAPRSLASSECRSTRRPSRPSIFSPRRGTRECPSTTAIWITSKACCTPRT